MRILKIIKHWFKRPDITVTVKLDGVEIARQVIKGMGR